METKWQKGGGKKGETERNSDGQERETGKKKAKIEMEKGRCKVK